MRVSGKEGTGSPEDEEKECEKLQKEMKISGHRESRQATEDQEIRR